MTTTVMTIMITRLTNTGTVITITPPTIMTMITAISTTMATGTAITTTAAATIITMCRPTWAWSSRSG